MAGFNGAGVLRPRKSDDQVNDDSSIVGLQWGRGFKTPEICHSKRADGRAGTLQWGRGFKTPEISQALTAVSASDALQWGRGFKTPEIMSSKSSDAE